MTVTEVFVAEPVGVDAAIDPAAVRQAFALLKPVVRLYHRAEATGVENVPDSGALIVGNHSGGVLAMDVPVIAVAFWEHFGVDRALHVLAHDVLMWGPVGEFFAKYGFLSASRENARKALADGGVTIVFPGGDYDAYRPTKMNNIIDFNGRCGYVRTALDAGVPIVPVVSIGGHETQLILTRGERLAPLFPWTKLLRTKCSPITFGFPWGLSLALPQFPLPTKIVTRFLEPIDPIAEFGPDPDIAAVDELVRSRMQTALDELAAVRRFPVLG